MTSIECIREYIMEKNILCLNRAGEELRTAQQIEDFLSNDLFAYVPVEAVDMFNYRINDAYTMYGSEESIYQVCHNACEDGFFTFDPYIDTFDTMPMLVLAWDRYVTLDENHCFTIWQDCNCSIEVYRANVALKSVFELTDGITAFDNFREVLYYMNLVSACQRESAFIKLLEEATEVVDEFFRVVMDYIQNTARPHLKYMDLMGLVTDDASISREIPKGIFRAHQTRGKDAFRVNVYSDNKVGVVYARCGCTVEKCFSLEIPEAVKIVEILPFLNANDDILHSLVSYACFLCGFVIDHRGIYSENPYRIPALNTKQVKPVKDIDGITLRC